MVYLRRIIFLEVETRQEPGGAHDSGDARHGGGDGVGVENVKLYQFSAPGGQSQALRDQRDESIGSAASYKVEGKWGE